MRPRALRKRVDVVLLVRLGNTRSKHIFLLKSAPIEVGFWLDSMFGSSAGEAWRDMVMMMAGSCSSHAAGGGNTK